MSNPVDIAANLSGGSSLDAGLLYNISANLSGGSSLRGVPATLIAANLSGGSSVNSRVGVNYAVRSNLGGSSSITARGTGHRSVHANLGGSSSLVGRLGYNVSANLGGSSSLVGRLGYNVSAHLTGSSTLSASATVELGGYEAPIRYQEPTRIVTSGKMILENVDLFLGDGRTRVVEVPVADLQLKVFCNSDEVNWPLVSGVGINDIRVTAGKVYWTEIADGFYNIRFFPSVLGLWRLILTYRAYDQAVSFTYDVVPKVSANPSTGVKTSFFKR